MPYTMADFRRDYILEHFPELTKQEQLSILRKLPLKERFKDLSPEDIQSYLQNLESERQAPKRKPRRKR